MRSPSQSKFNAIFETLTSKHGTVDVKQICGHLNCLYSGTDAPDMGAEPNSEDLSARANWSGRCLGVDGRLCAH